MKTKGILFAVLATATLAGGAYLLIQMNKKDDENTNFAGQDEDVIASSNYPFGQYFKDRTGIVVKSRPFYRQNRGTYKAAI